MWPSSLFNILTKLGIPTHLPDGQERSFEDMWREFWFLVGSLPQDVGDDLVMDQLNRVRQEMLYRSLDR